MIIYLLVLAVVCLFISMALIPKALPRIITSFLFAIIIVGSMVAMVSNDREHFGMKKVTEETSSKIYSPSPSKQMPMILYQNIGTKGTERVYIYKKTEDQKKPGHTPINNTSNVVKNSNNEDAKLVTKTTRWVYKSNAYKFWFGIAGNNHKLINRHNIFYIPKDWQSFSTTQAAKLQKLVKANQGKMKSEGEAYVKPKVEAAVKETVMKAMMKDPQLSPKSQQALIQQTSKEAAAKYGAEFQAKAMDKLIAEAKK